MIELDTLRMLDGRKAHSYLKEQLSFPEHYGRNLDALYDCLTDLDKTEVTFVNLEAGEDDTHFQKILRVFRDAAEDNDNLTVTNFQE